jgi:hypothetical protein
MRIFFTVSLETLRAMTVTRTVYTLQGEKTSIVLPVSGGFNSRGNFLVETCLLVKETHDRIFWKKYVQHTHW